MSIDADADPAGGAQTRASVHPDDYLFESPGMSMTMSSNTESDASPTKAFLAGSESVDSKKVKANEKKQARRSSVDADALPLGSGQSLASDAIIADLTRRLE